MSTLSLRNLTATNRIAATASRNLMTQSVIDRVIYSRIRVAAAVSYSSPTATLTISQQSLSAFGYGKGDVVPGHASTSATMADTCLQKKFLPPDNASAAIYAVSVRPIAMSEPRLLEALDRVMTFDLKLNDKSILRLGNLGDLGGVRPGMSYLSPGTADLASHLSGYHYEPINDGFAGLRFGEPILWSTDGADSNLEVVGEILEALTLTSTDRTAEASTSEVSFAAPQAAGARGTYVDLMVKLHCKVARPVSAN